MKKYFFTGLITLLPIALTIMLLVYILDFLTEPFIALIKNIVGEIPIKHKFFMTLVARIIILFGLFLVTTFIGFLVSKAFVNTITNLVQKIFQKIPFIKSVYNISKEIIGKIFSYNEKFFKETVLVKFPSENSYGIGFVTGEVPQEIKNLVSNIDTTVFIPTAPHPTQGFLLLTSRSDIITLPFSTEATFKLLISCGAINPNSSKI